MKKTLGLLLYAGVMFGVTAGLGMFMLKKTATQATGPIEAGGETSAVHEGHGTPGNHSVDTNVAATHHSESPENDSAHSQSAVSETYGAVQDERLPVVVRSTPMSVEEIVRMGLSLKSRDEVVQKREETLRETEAQQRLVLADIESAQQEIENLLARASDQRAAKEELLARVMAQNEALTLDRKGIADEKQQLLADQEKLDAGRKQLETEKSTLAQNQNELLLKRKELDADRQLLSAERASVTQDREKLIKDRKDWIPEQEKIASEKLLFAEEREQLRVSRELLEQEQRAFASSSGRPAGAVTSKSPLPDDATRQKNLKSLFEGMSPEVAASNIKELAAGGNSDMVVDVLLLLEQRKAGAILDALDDEKLSSEFLLKINSRNFSPKAAKKP